MGHRNHEEAELRIKKQAWNRQRLRENKNHSRSGEGRKKQEQQAANLRMVGIRVDVGATRAAVCLCDKLDHPF